MLKQALLYFVNSMITASLLAQPSYKFDFGSGKAAAGYIAITPTSLYNENTGYGFEKGAQIEIVKRSDKPLKGNFITGKRPFYFSVKLPEGNYDVKLLLGDEEGISATTVRAECRRLMLENILTTEGKVQAVQFTVHVRDSLIRNDKGEVVSQVRLKPREITYLHWDNKLTIEFNDSLPKICALEITPNKTATTIFLTGNSTVVDQDREPWAAWGQMFPRFLIPLKVVVANYAESGETLKAFRGERRLEKIMSLAKAGDYLFIEFAHNDQKPGGNHLDPFTTYKQALEEWINQAKRKGMIPVLVTSMHRRNFDSARYIINTLLEYPEAMRQVAREQGVALIDLNAMSKTLYEAWGPEASTRAFVHYPANSFPNQPEALKDNTHFSPYGAYSLAQCVVSSIQRQQLSLSKFIAKGISVFDPAKPMPFEQFYWPSADNITETKPDGN